MKTAVSTPQAIANYFIGKAQQENRSLSMMKLIKLVFIAYGWTLALLNRRLFDDPIEAWQHGPVIPALYHEFKHYGKSAIDSKAVTFDFSAEDTGFLSAPEFQPTDSRYLSILDKVWNAYKGLSAFQLRDLTHESGSPWAKSYVPGERHLPISDDLIKCFYTQFIQSLVQRA